MNRLSYPLVRLFDRVQAFAEAEVTRRRVGKGLILFFLASLTLIELNSLGLLPDFLASHVSMNRFHAVTQTFTLVLVLEVVELVFSLPKSTSRSVGKQFEILALILLRNAFKELTHLPVPIEVIGHTDVLIRLGLNGAGALAVFVLLGAYKYAQRCAPRHWAPDILAKFITAKKLVALLVLGAFIGMGAFDAYLLLSGQPTFDIFHDFYTLLIFTDILIVLIAQRYMPEFHAIFRNSGFALSTLFIRMALTADTILSVIMGVGAMVFAVALTYASNRFYALTTQPAAGAPCPLPASRK
ncbi:MAG TPA: hypothetical protein VN419_07495 [Humidesulfovibrio sp.]|uniref:hypothetical protein n=1 Tax=Humidesulfovibrio sp. TaxID=2910988 RepID=UPI002B883DF3|nr:hypothetical protein [Humidesulfovibrio sp.]HWR03849.1 hypothetical protein [Humidesulfovibrio sp.]